jgi:hypothetical protein
LNRSLFAVILEVCLRGTFIRRAGDPVEAVPMGGGISASGVNRMCVSFGTGVAAFRDRSVAGQPVPVYGPRRLLL